VIDYAVILVFEHEDGDQTLRVYDHAHGVNEMHRV